ncbi:unnamed protein product [Cylindrotheca closterium]|uniref:Subtilisin n=1 Tax=Cylindrotheca closterium TaxID=2856 RepID=A0AAD2FEJ1_9STRA|nr:unnamed protein product [Cylindrotheca closterium]
MKLSCSLLLTAAALCIGVASAQDCLICGDRPLDFPDTLVDLSDLGMEGATCTDFETLANQDATTPCAIYQLNRVTCCEGLGFVPDAPSNLGELCSTAASDFDSYLGCANACIEASCCGSSCQTDFACAGYLPCAVLETIADFPGQGGTVDPPPSPPSDVAVLCAAETISTDILAFLECANVCIAASCCTGSCSEEVSCIEYSACGILDQIEAPGPVFDGTPPSPPANLTDICAESAVNSGFFAYIGCVSACIPASCCEDACSTDPTCIEYIPCSILDTIDEPPFGVGGDGPSTGGPGTGGGPVSLPEAPSDLAEVCNATSVAADPISFLLCSNACNPARCCANSCSGDIFGCIAFAPCFVLDLVAFPEPSTEGPVPQAPSDLEALCDPEMIGINFDAYLGCVSACLPANCCGETCTTEAECMNYGPCGNLESVDEPPFGMGGGDVSDVPPDTGTGDAVPPAPSNLAELCAAGSMATDIVAYLECENACVPAACCIDTCSTDFATCFSYTPCLALQTVPSPEPSATGPVPTAPAALAELCDASMVGTNFNAYKSCIGACFPASCCNDGGCPTDANCLSYEPCLALDAVDDPPYGMGEDTPDMGEPTGAGTDAPAATPTTAPVAAPTAPTGPTAEGAEDSGANGTSGLFTPIRLVMSVLFTMAAVAWAE